MPLVAGESLTAYSFEFSIDGTKIPDVVEVNNIEQKVNLFENKAMTSTGVYQMMHMLGPRQSGQLTVTVLSTGDPSVTQWFMTGLSGDFKGARKTGTLIYKDTYGSPVQTIEFTNLMLTGVSYGALKAGESSGINMTISMAFTEMKVS
jgi:phage tail-like protein